MSSGAVLMLKDKKDTTTMKTAPSTCDKSTESPHFAQIPAQGAVGACEVVDLLKLICLQTT